MRIDHEIIANCVEPNSKILDLGCGNGELLQELIQTKNIEGSGIEIRTEGVQQCIAKGLSVIQGDLEDLIFNYGDKVFDYCILSQTLQDLHQPDKVIAQMARVSKHIIVTFYNLAHYTYRFQILLHGRMPKSKDLPYKWLTTNITFLSVLDFKEYCDTKQITIDKAIYLKDGVTKREFVKYFPHWRAKLCIFEISPKNGIKPDSEENE
jgi:methionine biosynthesis protein MetW